MTVAYRTLHRPSSKCLICLKVSERSKPSLRDKRTPGCVRPQTSQHYSDMRPTQRYVTIHTDYIGRQTLINIKYFETLKIRITSKHTDMTNIIDATKLDY